MFFSFQLEKDKAKLNKIWAPNQQYLVPIRRQGSLNSSSSSLDHFLSITSLFYVLGLSMMTVISVVFLSSRILLRLYTLKILKARGEFHWMPSKVGCYCLKTFDHALTHNMNVQLSKSIAKVMRVSLASMKPKSREPSWEIIFSIYHLFFFSQSSWYLILEKSYFWDYEWFFFLI